MLFEQRFWEPIRRGEVTCTFRRWKRPQVVAGRRYRTPVGLIEVVAVTIVDPAQISDAEARRSGYPDADRLRADLRGDPSMPVRRIEFAAVAEPDPRAVLAGRADLDTDAAAELDVRLDRLDRAAPDGPWTRATLGLIRDRPGVRAGDLAAELGRDRAAFKLDVRKLKNLGLTISLEVGYRLSPRGEAYLTAAE